MQCCKCKTPVDEKHAWNYDNNIKIVDYTFVIESKRVRGHFSEYEDFKLVFVKDLFKFVKYTVKELKAKYKWLSADAYICDSCIKGLLSTVELIADEWNGGINAWPTPCVSCNRILDKDDWIYHIHDEYTIIPARLRSDFYKYIDNIEPEIYYGISNYRNDNTMKFLQSKQPYKDICYHCVRRLEAVGLIYTNRPDLWMAQKKHEQIRIEENMCYYDYGIMLNKLIFNYPEAIMYKQYLQKCKLVAEIKLIALHNDYKQFVIMDLLIEVARMFNTKHPTSVCIKMIFKLMCKNTFNKIHVGMLSDINYRKLPNNLPSDSFLNLIELFPNLVVLSVYYSWITDEHIIRLKKSLGVLYIIAYPSSITNESIKQLNLHCLMSNVKFTDETIKQNKNIRYVSIHADKNNIENLSELSLKELVYKPFKGLQIPQYIPTKINAVFIPYDSEHDLSLIENKNHALYTLSVPSEHIDFFHEYRFIHNLELGISDSGAISRIINRSEYFKSLKLTTLDISASASLNRSISLENIIKLLENFNTKCIKKITIHINEKLVYKNGIKIDG